MRRIFPLKPSENRSFTSPDGGREFSGKKKLNRASSGFQDDHLFRSLSMDRRSNNLKALDKENVRSFRIRRENRCAACRTGNTGNCENSSCGHEYLPHLNKDRDHAPSRELKEASFVNKRSTPAAVPVFTAGSSRNRVDTYLSTRRPSQDGVLHGPVREPLPTSSITSMPSTSSGRINGSHPKSFKIADDTARSNSAPKGRLSLDPVSRDTNLRANSMRLPSVPSKIAGLCSADLVNFEGMTSTAVSQSGTLLGNDSRMSSFSESTDSSSCFTKAIGSSSRNSQEFSSSLSSDSCGTGNTVGSGKLRSSKSPFRHLSARFVAERLVKVLKKEKFCSQLSRTSSEVGQISGRREVGSIEGEIVRDSSYSASIASNLNVLHTSLPLGEFKDPHLSDRKPESLLAHAGSQSQPPKVFGRTDYLYTVKCPAKEHSHSFTEAGRFRFPSSARHQGEDEGNFRAWLEGNRKNEDALEARARAREEQAASWEREIEFSVDELRTDVEIEDPGYSMTNYSFDALRQEIKNLREERRNLALEVASEIRSRLSERVTMDEVLKNLKAEMECQVKMIENEKADIQGSLEKELEKRGADWTSKLEKIKSEERWLRERVRVIAEEKVGLQKEIASVRVKESVLQGQVKESLLSIDCMKQKAEKAETEIPRLQQALADSRNQVKAIEDERDMLVRSYKEKERLNTDLQKALVRLQRRSKDQEKTIQGLWHALDESANGKSENKEHVVKLQRELLRLTGLEQALRSEQEAMRGEATLLKQENNNLLESLKIAYNGGKFEMIRLDQELRARMDGLHAQALALQDDNRRLSTELRAVLREKRDAEETLRLFQLSREKVECGTGLAEEHERGWEKLEEQKRDFEQLEKKVDTLQQSTHMLKNIIGEKSNLMDDEGKHVEHLQLGEPTITVKEKIKELQGDLKAETILCKVLREKLYSREMELEQLNGEVATLVQTQDWLETEVDELQKSLVSSNNQVRELECQLVEKEDKISLLNGDLEEHLKELKVLREELPRIKEQRDEMRNEAENMSREALRLSAEVEGLRRKVEKLDEDVMLKEGQISILRGTFDDSD